MRDAPETLWVDPSSEDDLNMYVGHGSRTMDYLNMDVEYIRKDALPSMVAPLVLPERRNGYWGSKSGGYQIAYTSGGMFRVRLHGRVICRDIKGFDKAVKWANAHHVAQIMAAFKGAE